MAAAGRVIPARHEGSVDVFLDAIDRARAGDVLVIDNDGRSDEGCVGDLVTMEAQAAGLAGIAVWGCHRDTRILFDLGMPLWSYGSVPAGPTRARVAPCAAAQRVRFGDVDVHEGDVVFLDDDGAAFVPGSRLAEVERATREILAAERRQAERVRGGRSLREQLRFAEYRARLAQEPGLTFREHLRSIGGSIEE